MGISMIGGYGLTGYSSVNSAQETSKVILNPGESTKVAPGKTSSPAECQTCKERKYVDGSNEADVSYKTPTHISPGRSTGAVMAHEQMHVANAYAEEASGNAEVVSANVSIKYAICPECGRSYASGGETTTTIKYTQEQLSSPYVQNAISFGAANGDIGGNMDIAV